MIRFGAKSDTREKHFSRLKIASNAGDCQRLTLDTDSDSRDDQNNGNDYDNDDDDDCR